MRGKPDLEILICCALGITPARAGKTEMLLMVRQMTIGSPPRVRGKRLAILLISRISRITPARAGKTDWENGYNEIGKDHPRACGENR